MKTLYFMAAADGAFNSNTTTAPDSVCYPLSAFKGLTSKDTNECYIYFASAQAAGTDEANNTSGTDLITFTISTADNHKNVARSFAQEIHKFIGKDNGFAVILDSSSSEKFDDDVDLSSSFTILTDNPA